MTAISHGFFFIPVAKMVREKTREEFIVWIRLAMNDRESGAYEELYQFLTSCFVRAE